MERTALVRLIAHNDQDIFIDPSVVYAVTPGMPGTSVVEWWMDRINGKSTGTSAKGTPREVMEALGIPWR